MTESALTNTPESSVYKNEVSFELYQRMAKSLAGSNLVPVHYQGQEGLANCLVALEMANRMNISPLVVMQNMNVIHGKPSWSAQFITATIIGSGRFEDLDYEEKGTKKGDEVFITACRCKAIRTKDKKEVCGAWVSLDMAEKEGWTRNSKWKTMPSLMLRYRAASFFGRQYVADLLLGIQTEDEIVDIQPVNVTVPNTPHEAAIAQPREKEPLVEEDKPTKKEAEDGFGF
tara:strand:- start:2221 stop:2910 length:690 start_codon:yes stop_codon:yes gene_type:complete